eukprot:7015633-Pyramimonas_sp.AAC.1
MHWNAMHASSRSGAAGAEQQTLSRSIQHVATLWAGELVLLHCSARGSAARVEQVLLFRLPPRGSARGGGAKGETVAHSS